MTWHFCIGPQEKMSVSRKSSHPLSASSASWQANSLYEFPIVNVRIEGRMSPSPWRRPLKCRMSDVASAVWRRRSERISKSCRICVSRRGSRDETHEDSEEHRWPEAEPGRDYVQSPGDTDQPQVSANKPWYLCYKLPIINYLIADSLS